MEIKPCLLENINDLVFIAKKVYQDHYLYLWDDNGDYYMNLNFTTAPFKRELADLNSAFYLLYHEEQLVGFLKLNLNSKLKNYSPFEALELERIYFIKEATLLGFGTIILNYVIELAKKRNKNIVWLKAMSRSKSVDFYQKNQFTVVD